MIKHFGIYENSTALQGAYNNGDIINPYVALVSGALDYNSVQPQIDYLARWSNDGQGTYTLTVLDGDPSKWVNETNIAVIPNAYFDTVLSDVNITLHKQSTTWYVQFSNTEASSPEIINYEDGIENFNITSNAMLDPEASNSGIQVTWDGVDSFVFACADTDITLSMNTIDPVDE